MLDYVGQWADVSPDESYRYSLEREWHSSTSGAKWRWLGVNDGAGKPIGEPKTCLFVMLNPSTADALKDDPTIRRCVGFANRLRYDALQVVNLFAARASSPKELFNRAKEGKDIIGPRNQEVIECAATRAGIIICAWGVNGGWAGQDETVRGWLQKASALPH